MKGGAVGVFAVFVLACSNPGQQRVCTLIGCSDGLTIEVTGNIASRTTIEVTAPGQTPRTFECNAGQQCRGFLENYTPSQATVTVRLSDRTVQRNITPQYREARPNGADCPPVCRQATVQVAI